MKRNNFWRLTKAIIPHRRFRLQTFTINPHQIASGMIINHRLPCLAILRAAQKKPAVRPVIIIHLQRHLGVAVLLVRNNNPAIPGNILRPMNRTILHRPLPRGLILTRAAVPRFRTRMPSLQRLPIKNGNKPFLSRSSAERNHANRRQVDKSYHEGIMNSKLKFRNQS